MTEQSPSTEIAERDSAVNPLTLAVEQFDPEQQQVIAKFVGLSDAKDPALLPFLGVAAHLGLSPILGEIWLIKGQRKVDDTWEDFYRPAVGRDGYLKKAREHPNFKRVRSAFVCANDTFEVEDDGDEVKMLHRYASLPKGIDAKKASRYRGPVIGAWAKLFYRDDELPFFHYIQLHEHAKVRETTKDGEKVTDWEGSWAYTAEMAEKCVLSYVLRIGLGLSGAVPVDELIEGRLAAGQAGGGEAAEPPLDANPDEANDAFVNGLGISDELKQTLREALHEVNELMPFSWAPAKVAIVLTDANAEQVLADIEAEITRIREQKAKEEASAVADAVQVLAAEDLEPGMRIRVALSEGDSGNTIVLSAVLAREGKIILCAIVKGKEEELTEIDPKDEVEVLERDLHPGEKKDKGEKT